MLKKTLHFYRVYTECFCITIYMLAEFLLFWQGYYFVGRVLSVMAELFQCWQAFYYIVRVVTILTGLLLCWQHFKYLFLEFYLCQED